MAASRTKYDTVMADTLKAVRMMIDNRLRPFTVGNKVLGSAIVGYIGSDHLPAVPLAKMVPDIAEDPPLDPAALSGMQVRVGPAGDALVLQDTAATDAAAKILAWSMFT